VDAPRLADDDVRLLRRLHTELAILTSALIVAPGAPDSMWQWGSGSGRNVGALILSRRKLHKP
jgi:hypothetical protein